MNELNEYTKQGITLRKYVFERIGELLFAERRKHEQRLDIISRQTNITQKFIDKAECGVGKSRWTIIALLLKHYKKELTITLTDIKKE
ncbi:MAG: hypothetical protein NC218_06490 [Acetobacter sp.]|nr:hypothetical protein [Acetobacter sp.]